MLFGTPSTNFIFELASIIKMNYGFEKSSFLTKLHLGILLPELTGNILLIVHS